MTGRLSMMSALSGLLVAAAALLAAGCGHGCGGQCYPYQATVIFRPGIAPAADRAVLLSCRGNADFIQAGQVHRSHGGGWPAGALAATVFARSMAGRKSVSLLTCLRASSAVMSAGFPG
ncbi:MAG TPA: hypothetical protein VGG35_15745 [Streptosporangiaceae bacterium]|jgi:hypothetical protein